MFCFGALNCELSFQHWLERLTQSVHALITRCETCTDKSQTSLQSTRQEDRAEGRGRGQAAGKNNKIKPKLNHKQLPRNCLELITGRHYWRGQRVIRGWNWSDVCTPHPLQPGCSLPCGSGLLAPGGWDHPGALTEGCRAGPSLELHLELRLSRAHHWGSDWTSDLKLGGLWKVSKNFPVGSIQRSFQVPKFLRFCKSQVWLN